MTEKIVFDGKNMEYSVTSKLQCEGKPPPPQKKSLALSINAHILLSCQYPNAAEVTFRFPFSAHVKVWYKKIQRNDPSKTKKMDVIQCADAHSQLYFDQPSKGR